MLCPTEDSTNCLWLAFAQGNGQGLSFADIGGVFIPLNDLIGTTVAVGIIGVMAIIGITLQRIKRG